MNSEYVFPNDRSSTHLSANGMLTVVNRMHKVRVWVDDFGEKITVHGFRSTMRDYVAEQTDIDVNMRNEFKQLSQAFDDQGNLIQNSVMENGTTVSRAIDQNGNLLLRSLDATGERVGDQV